MAANPQPQNSGSALVTVYARAIMLTNPRATAFLAAAFLPPMHAYLRATAFFAVPLQTPVHAHTCTAMLFVEAVMGGVIHLATQGLRTNFVDVLRRWSRR